MSYGYLVASSSSIPEIQKSRRFRFFLLDSSDGFYIYSRLEESNELTIRDGQKSLITDAGAFFIASIPVKIFFMDYLLVNKKNETDLIKAVKSDIKLKNFKTVHLPNFKEVVLNDLYMVIS